MTCELALAAGPAMLAGATAIAADKPAVCRPVDKAFEALKTYDWGTDRNGVEADRRRRGGHLRRRGRPARTLETRLAAVLKTGASRDAKDYVCRKLMVIGTAESVPALAALLPDKDLSHMARYALERIPAPEAAQAMRDALPKLSGALKVGVIGSLGVRRDAASVRPWRACWATPTRRSPARPLRPGRHRQPGGRQGPGRVAKKAPEGVKPAVADACLVCAERLLADGKKAEAIAFTSRSAAKTSPSTSAWRRPAACWPPPARRTGDWMNGGVARPEERTAWWARKPRPSLRSIYASTSHKMQGVCVFFRTLGRSYREKHSCPVVGNVLGRRSRDWRPAAGSGGAWR